MQEKQRIVFISCGQCTDEERELGDRVCKLVDEITPFRGYFAKNQVSLSGVSENILKQLYNSVALIAIMHRRGVVETLPPDPYFTRASVWIEQEIAIAAFMEQVLNRRLHVALFVQYEIKLEGIRTQIQLNPIEFTTGDDVITKLREILPTWKEPLFIGDDELRKRADSVDLSAKVVSGRHQQVSIEINNHSGEDVEIRSLVLSNKDKKLCAPVSPPPNYRWFARAGGYLPITFNSNEDVGYRLIGFYGKTQDMFVAQTTHAFAHFTAEITVELRCEILGVKKTIQETCSVQVDLGSRDINGL